MITPRLDWVRQWLRPMALLALAALAAFAPLYLLDHWRSGAGGFALVRYFSFDADMLTDAISQLAPAIVALLGIVVTVVAIIVQLSSSRYSGVARMFLGDRVNRLVIGYYVVSGLVGVWLSVTLQPGFVPRLLLLATLLAASFGMLLMLPYFGYVFWFLEPANLVRRIRQMAIRAAARALRGSVDRIDHGQQVVLNALLELNDIATHAISGKDKIIASRAADAVRDFLRDYLVIKERADDAWFRVGRGIAHNPDFLAMDPESLQDLQSRRIWLEWQALRQYLSIYNEALAAMRDLAYVIAIDTRRVGEMASERGDVALVELVLRYMNSYLRATLNARDIRTAYNVLNQYRLLAHTLLRERRGEFALEAARHMSYYGHIGFDYNLNFVTETVAYDISALCQAAHELDALEQDRMVGVFLKLDRPLRVKSQERALLGVRKAQVKLAAYYLSAGDHERARTVALDMREEPYERLAIIRGELEAVDSKDFWEIIDRGRTFEYMPEAQRAMIGPYFELLQSLRD